jgi:hypothetical protein
MMAVVGTMPLAHGQTTSWLSFSANPVLTGGTVSVRAGLTTTPGASSTAPAGTLVLERYLVNGIPASCSVPGGTFAKVAMSTTGSISYKAPTSIPGSFGYQSRLYALGVTLVSSCADLVINAQAVCTGMQIGVTEVQGATTAHPGTYTGGFQVTVHNCGLDTVSNVKAQGGTAGWTTVSGISATAGDWSASLKTGGTQVITWNLGDMPAGANAVMTVGLTGQIDSGTPNGTILNVSGAWSAAGAQANPVTLTVVNP